jgi:hypothetical protein
MTAYVLDKQLLESISPGDLAAYLRSHNWKQVEQIGNRASVWTKPSDTDEEFEVLLPLIRSTSDYARRISESLDTLSIAEQVHTGQLYRDITTTNADIVRVRLQHNSITNGSIPLENGVRMVNEIRDAILAAACATVSPRALFQSRKPGEAMHFMENLKLGQTEAGSFIMSVESSVAPKLRHQGLFDDFPPNRDSEPFERRVLLRLNDSLGALSSALLEATGTADAKPFQDAVPLGVSANLCDALVGLGMDGTAEEVSFQFSWAPVRPVNEQTKDIVRFGRDAFPVLREAARILREQAPQEDHQLMGRVIALRRAEQDYEGRIMMAGLVDGKWRNVRVDLTGRDYQTAVKAHYDKDYVQAVGDLVRHGRGYDLINVREFVVMELPELDENEGGASVEYPMGSGEPAVIREESDPFADG